MQTETHNTACCWYPNFLLTRAQISAPKCSKQHSLAYKAHCRIHDGSFLVSITLNQQHILTPTVSRYRISKAWRSLHHSLCCACGCDKYLRNESHVIHATSCSKKAQRCRLKHRRFHSSLTLEMRLTCYSTSLIRGGVSVNYF